MFNVQWNFIDQYNRRTNRTFRNIKSDFTQVMADVAIMAPLIQAIVQGGVESVVVSQKDAADAFAVSAEDSNVDEGMTLSVLGGDGFNYPVKIPMPRNDLRLSGGSINTSDADVVAFLAKFDGGVGNDWRINLRNPTTIVSVNKGTLDT